MGTTSACADCGAAGCEALFHACLVADFSDRGYGAVHHLVVAAYGLQHGWFTAEATATMVEFVLAHLDRAPTDHDRRQIREAAEGPVRVRATPPRRLGIDWELNVAHVDRGHADSYCATVRAWAASVAAALRAVERATGGGDR